MDPISIFQIVGAAVSLSDVVLKCITRLSSLKTKYHNAPLHLSTMIGQLYMVQAALDQLSAWNKPDYGRDRNPRYQQLGEQIGNSLDCFGLLILTLQKQLDHFESFSALNMAARMRIKFLWSEKEMADYSTLLDRQVNALSLLLQAIQCETWTKQHSHMSREESQSVLTLAKGCSSSIFGCDDRHSVVSETTANISVAFDFDTFLLGSRIYQQAERSHLRQVIRAENGKKAIETLPKATTNEKNNRNTAAFMVTSIDLGSDDQHSKQNHTRSSAHQVSAVQDVHHTENTENDSQPYDHRTSNLSERLPSKAVLANQYLLSRMSKWWKRSPRYGANPELIQRGQGTPPSSPKVLILGTSESGKSTLYQTLSRISSPQRYTTDERFSYFELIWTNVVNGVQVVLQAMDQWEMTTHESNVCHVETIYCQPWFIEGDESPDIEVTRAIELLWGDYSFQAAFKRRREYQLSENLQYYVAHIKRLMASDYVPTDEDILRTRVKTTGYVEDYLDYSGLIYKIFDVGGMRSERKNWIHVFEKVWNVWGVIFTVDTTGYARLLFEDETVNRMDEQLESFASVVTSKWFARSRFLLVFTKMDIIGDWLREHPTKNYIPDFVQEERYSVNHVESYLQYLEMRFKRLIASKTILENMRVIRTNLVDSSSVPGTEICEALKELTELPPL